MEVHVQCFENIFSLNLDGKPITTNEANEDTARGRQSLRAKEPQPGPDRSSSEPWAQTEHAACVHRPLAGLALSTVRAHTLSELTGP